MAELKNTTINDTSSLQLPVGTTAERPGSPVDGYMRFNSEESKVEYYSNGEWLFLPPLNIVTDGLVLYLDAGNSESYPGSGTTWFDLSGNGNNGTLVNGVSYNSSNGGTLFFDGVNDYVTTSATVEAATNSNLQTISGWLIGDGELFGSNANSTGQFHLKVALSGTTLTYRVSYYGGTSGETNDTSTVSPFSANNIVIVKTSPQKYDVYFNGNKVMNQVTKKATVSVNFYPGYYYGGTSWNGGTVSNYLIYNRSLTESEIQQNFNATKGRFGL